MPQLNMSIRDTQDYALPIISLDMMESYLASHGWYICTDAGYCRWWRFTATSVATDDIPNTIKIVIDENDDWYAFNISMAIYYISEHLGKSCTDVYSDIVGGNGFNMVSGSRNNMRWHLNQMIAMSTIVSNLLREIAPEQADAFDVIIAAARKSL